MTIALISLLALGMLLCFVGSVVLIVAAFRVGIGWGLCVLFLPFAALVFVFVHWHAAKRALGFYLFGLLALSAAMLLSWKTDPEQTSPPQFVTQGLEQIKTEMAKPIAKVMKSGPETYIGLSLDDVRDTLGKPTGEMSANGAQSLFYDGFILTSTNGQTITHAKVTAGREKKKKATRRAAIKAPAVETISNGGREVDLKSILVPGKITIVDFYAEWCGPCRDLGPKLEQFARGNPDVCLRKINIVNWGTPVVKQYGIRSVPNVQVYDKNGRKVGAMSGSQSICDLVSQAR
ncbi:MAG: thioredoxin family protein [Verrucomicrobia bacterium]|jgi:thiol-disulfide isomerase/thioredoxin|nr:thioredoxin family protein [Verrucomicrobiota bacterium]